MIDQYAVSYVIQIGKNSQKILAARLCTSLLHGNDENRSLYELSNFTFNASRMIHAFFSFFIVPQSALPTKFRKVSKSWKRESGRNESAKKYVSLAKSESCFR